jgi:hypothetical protein
MLDEPSDDCLSVNTLLRCWPGALLAQVFILFELQLLRPQWSLSLSLLEGMEMPSGNFLLKHSLLSLQGVQQPCEGPPMTLLLL